MSTLVHHDKNEKEKIRRSLRYSVLDGSFNSAKIGFGESFFQAFAILLKATTFQIALLGSLPLTLGSLGQLYSNKIIERYRSRKKAILAFALLEGLMYIPIALVYFTGDFRVFHLILFACLYWIFGMLVGPAWNSWMGDLVDEKNRGDYFGRRNKICGLINFMSFVAGGYLLQQFADGFMVRYFGFMLLFLIAFLARIVSICYLSMKYEPEYQVSRANQFTFIEFLKQARFRNYGLFVIYLCSMNLAVYVAAPFFAAYWLNDLRWDYQTFTVVSATAIIVKYLTMPIWGKASDRFGTKKVLAVSGFLMPLTPLLWIFGTDVWYCIAVQVYSGFVWAGFEIASFNFIFDSTTSQKRATCVAYYNVLNGFAILAGSLLGGLVIKYNDLFWTKYYAVFIFSCLLRYLTSFVLLPRLREVRSVENISDGKLLLNVITSLPTIGHIHHMITFRDVRDHLGLSKRKK